MPELPPGEEQLRALAGRFRAAERRLLEQVGRGGARALADALLLIIALRQLDARGPIVAAYLASGGRGVGAVDDLAVSLAAKLDRGAETAQGNVRRAFVRPPDDPLDTVVAHVDRSGQRWGLGAYAEMTTQTIGRTATSRGVVDAVGKGGRVTVAVGECAYCQELFEGELVVGVDPLPPGHPNCSCVAVPA